MAANWITSAKPTQVQAVALPTIPATDKITVLDALTQSLTATATGVALGIAHSELRNGLDVHKKPIDLAGSVVFTLAGYFGKSRTLMTMGNVCEGVYTFRKTIELLGQLEMTAKHRQAAEAPKAEPKTETENVENDPVVMAAKGLDPEPESVVDTSGVTVHGEAVA
jgi:hypothetical protein